MKEKRDEEKRNFSVRNHTTDQNGEKNFPNSVRYFYCNQYNPSHVLKEFKNLLVRHKKIKKK